MIKANVILDYSKWKNKIKNPNNYLKKKLNKLSKIPYFKKKKQEFSILLTNNVKMKNLNNKFRKKNKPTDVLSFPLNNFLKKNIYIGDIAISYEITNQRSKKGMSFESSGDLNMKMGLDDFSANEAINKLDAIELEKIFKFFGEEKEAKKIVLRIIKERKKKKINTKKLIK